jgi:hypothetical protein
MMEGPELDDDNGPLRSSHDGLFFICMELAPAYADDRHAHLSPRLRQHRDWSVVPNGRTSTVEQYPHVH